MGVRNILSPYLLLDEINARKKEREKKRKKERDYLCSHGKQENVLFLALTHVDRAKWSAASFGLLADLPRTVT